MEDKNNSFMDSRTIIAVVLIGVVWVGWQKYIEQKYPQPEVLPTAVSDVETKAASGAEKVISTSEAKAVTAPTQEVLTNVDQELYSFDISSEGMSLKNITLKTYLDRENGQIQIGHAGAFGIEVGGKPVSFRIEKTGDSIVGFGEFGQYKIKRTLKFIGGAYGAESDLEITGVDDLFPGVGISLNDQIRKVETSFLFPSFDNQEVMVGHSEDVTDRIVASSEKETKEQSFASTTVAAIGTHYFALGLVDKSEIIPTSWLKLVPADSTIKLFTEYKRPSGLNNMSIKNRIYFGPKDMAALKSVDDKLVSVVNYGYFATIARILHAILKWFYDVVGNWGFAIILLTLLVRMVVLPFHIMSFKSMKAMQDVQPMIQSLRERYKDDAAALNREMMDLFKRKKVNPLGGCLPMLLQIPVFFALYQVFGQSIDLYRAPFAFWISDLSVKDPFYVLPVLMGIVMFLQQKMTPTTMDPTQAKIMLAMPVVFSLMMVNLPSALTLYLFVSTFFGIVQQYFVLHEKRKSKS